MGIAKSTRMTLSSSPLRNILFATLLASSTLAACAPADSGDSQCEDGKCDTSSTLKLCAAVRGNGELITAHFGSLARIVEHFGTIDAASGGSSASITVFLTESMHMHPAISDCNDSQCSPNEEAARTALLLKSFPAYLQHLTTTEEAAALGQLAPFITRIQSEGIEAVLDENPEEGVAALLNVLEQDELTDLINPEVIGLLQNSPNPEMHARDILEGIQKLGAFSADTDRIFIRPGILNFEALADKFGRVADFYSGNGPADIAGMSDFMDSCATPGLGKGWFEVAALPAGSSTCGQVFDSMLGDYRAALAADPGSFRSRIDEPVGGKMRALISTSVLSGATADSFKQARADYEAAKEYTFTPNFDEVSFGYWGQSADLETLSRNENGYDDLKTAKFTPLGETTWRTALSYSPAEPGLARGIELPDGRVSTGGWSDLHPVLALRNLGCEQVVYVTRTGDESGFATGVASLLGMSADQSTALYDLDNDSAYALSLIESDATWCTDWNAQSGTDLVGISADGYNAPMESTSAFFTDAASPYENLSAATNLRGCTPGAARPAQDQ